MAAGLATHPLTPREKAVLYHVIRLTGSNGNAVCILLFPGHAVMTNVILALGWASVTIIHDSGLYGAMFAVYPYPIVPTPRVISSVALRLFAQY